MSYFTYVAIFSNQIMENMHEVIFYIRIGFTNVNKKDRLQTHVGGFNSAHNQVWKKCEALMDQNQHLEIFFERQPDKARNEYRSYLNASVDFVRFLIRQGSAFRGDDKSKNSSNQDNFLKLLQFLSDHNDDTKAVTLKNTPKYLKLTSLDIQNDIVSVATIEIINVIMKDINSGLFSILVDELHDISMKEYMTVVLRYVNEN